VCVKKRSISLYDPPVDNHGIHIVGPRIERNARYRIVHWCYENDIGAFSNFDRSDLCLHVDSLRASDRQHEALVGEVCNLYRSPIAGRAGGSRNLRLNILPLASRGNLSRNLMSLGTLKFASRLRR
jgi:hypothetical protein